MKAVFFDLFETLITEFSNGKRISNRNYDYKKLLGLEYPDFKKAWSSRRDRRMTGEIASFKEAIIDILNELNKPIPHEAIDYLYQARMKEKEIPFQSIRTDIRDLLQYLKDQNIKLGLISNCAEEEVQFWKNCKLTEYFDDVILSYDVGLAKPDKEIYLLGCSNLCVDPSESIFIGDGGSNELDGAKNAGMTPFHVTWFNPTVDSSHNKFDSPEALLTELKKYI